jgi:AraC-like DNA-binding protein
MSGGAAVADWSLVVPRRDVARGSPERVFAAPHRGLAGRALTYTGHDLPDTGRVPWRTAPLGAVVLTVDLGPPSAVRFADSAAQLPPSPVLGLRDRPLVLEQRGALRGVVVALTPSGAHDLFGGAVGGLANTAVGLEDLLGADGRVLAERLTEADGWAARFALLDGFLAGRPPPRRAPDAEVREAWRRLWTTPDVRVGELARELGWSRQRLHARFRAQVGLGPKAVARTARLHRAVRLLDGPGRALADVAVRSGYADQSHLHRDFRALAGVTPAEYAARGGVSATAGRLAGPPP